MIRRMKQTVKHLLPRSLWVTRLRPSAGNTVLLTFDDGPHPKTTPAVLDRLAEFGAHAVFFVVGNRVDRAPDVLSRIVREGHWIGNHTYTHPNDRQMPYREYLNELLRCQEIVVRHTGIPPRLHRPPQRKITLASLAAPKACGLVTLDCTHDADDWRFQSADAAVARAGEMIQLVQACDVLLFHDESSHTLVALDRLLPALVSRGLSLSPDLGHII
jgi:peptidoglycan-N-acetylglucosamine deacetylase